MQPDHSLNMISGSDKVEHNAVSTLSAYISQWLRAVIVGYSLNQDIIICKKTDRCFRYASPCLWNQFLFYLFVDFILVSVPHFPTHLFIYPSLHPLLIHHSDHPQLLLSFTPSLKPTCFTNPTHHSFTFPSGQLSRTIDRTDSSELLVFCFSFSLFLFLLSCARLSWPSHQLLTFWAHVNNTISFSGSRILLQSLMDW